MYISWQQLADTGWDIATLPASQIQVWRQGVQVPILVDTRGISFRAEANASRFSQEAAYWLVIGTEEGMRTTMPAVSSQPLTWEPDQVYQSLVPSARGDRWFAGELRDQASDVGGHGSGGLPISIQVPVALPAGTRVELSVTPYTLRFGHQIALWHGATRVGLASWDDTTGEPQTLSLTTSAALPAGDVNLMLTLTSAGSDIVLVDSITIPDAHIPLPTRTPALEPVRPIPTIAATNQLIIAHPSLIPALAPLVAMKQQAGRRVAVADVLAIYDAYSWGERDPEAIRLFIAGLAKTGRQGDRETRQFALCLPISPSPCLESILLVGAGSARMRVGPAEADPTLIPPYLLDVDGVYGEIACDTCYTRLDADNPRADLLPDLAIGRIPARTLAEAEVMIAKTVAVYRDVKSLISSQNRTKNQEPRTSTLKAIPTSTTNQEPRTSILKATPAFTTLAGASYSASACLPVSLSPCLEGSWSRRMLLVADNDRDSLGNADPAGPFTPLLEVFTHELAQLQPIRFVYAPDQNQNDGLYRDAPVLRDRLFDAWDSGAALVAYVGHANAWQWAWTGPHEPVAHLMARSDAVRTNDMRLPILLSMTCLSGSLALLHNPNAWRFGGALLPLSDRLANRYCVAVWHAKAGHPIKGGTANTPLNLLALQPTAA